MNADKLAAYDVSWNVPGPSSAESMPIGNGDIGLNVWTETNGDVVFYIGKSDAWGSVVQADDGGLMKIGRVRLSLHPSQLQSSVTFAQVLHLGRAEITVQEGETQIRTWVDANLPVIHAEITAPHPVEFAASLENWRLPGPHDPVFDQDTNQVTWCHRNPADADPHVANLTFGAMMKGADLVGRGGRLTSTAPAKSHQLAIYVLTRKTDAPEDWLKAITSLAATVDAIKPAKARRAHEAWWRDFWQRSWIYVAGDTAAETDTRGYILQRFVTACAGRGAYPIKFNGSIFVVDNPALPQDHGRPPRVVTADYRTWGGQYWFQNTRPMYWPRLAAGDFDLMRPLFDMYVRQLPGNSNLVAKYYHHAGAYLAETAPFWGGLRYWGPEVKEDWTGHYFTPILELTMMALDYYDYTGDESFARQTLIPLATAGISFFDYHFGRDAENKLLLDPDNAIETYWKVHDPAPDIAGLQAVLPRLLKLPNQWIPPERRRQWEQLLAAVPPLPIGETGGHPVLLPYTGPQTAPIRNGENPELYALYPFRLYGLKKPSYDLVLDTFNARRFRQKGCWVQDPIQAAMLGLSAVAKEYVTFNFTRTDPRLKFPAFWLGGNDYAPDEDNGGNGENGLQQMLLQSDGRKILLLPAWPREWSADFKLHAAFGTTVSGRVQAGKLMDLSVTPRSRRADVIDCSQKP